MDGQMKESSAPTPENYELKWHKFLIYFALWASAVMNVVSSIAYFTGSIYGNSARQVYNHFGGMRTLDVIMGLLLLGIAGFSIYVRFQLAGFKTGAPKKLEYLYIANVAIPLLYLLAASSVTGLSFTDLASGTWGSLAGSVVMIFVNRTYYGKREALFVN